MGKSARYDSSRVKLRTGEYQKPDGRYEFRYTVFGIDRILLSKHSIPKLVSPVRFLIFSGTKLDSVAIITR